MKTNLVFLASSLLLALIFATPRVAAQAPDGAEVPDPYYGEQEDFAEVFDLVDAAAKGLVGHLADLL